MILVKILTKLVSSWDENPSKKTLLAPLSFKLCNAMPVSGFKLVHMKHIKK